MRIRPLPLLVLLAVLAMPASALAQSAGDDQYTNPVPQTQAPPSSGSSSGSGGGGSGSTSTGTGSGSSSGAGTSADTTTSTGASSSDGTTSTGSGSGSGSSAETLPRTGLPVGVLAALGLLFTFTGRGLRRASKEPAPDPYAERVPEVPPPSPVSRAARRRSD